MTAESNFASPAASSVVFDSFDLALQPSPSPSPSAAEAAQTARRWTAALAHAQTLSPTIARALDMDSAPPTADLDGIGSDAGAHAAVSFSASESRSRHLRSPFTTFSRVLSSVIPLFRISTALPFSFAIASLMAVELQSFTLAF